jgi:hypothetical protein
MAWTMLENRRAIEVGGRIWANKKPARENKFQLVGRDLDRVGHAAISAFS